MGIFGGRGMVIQGLRFLAPKDALAALCKGALLVDLRHGECPCVLRPRKKRTP